MTGVLRLEAWSLLLLCEAWREDDGPAPSLFPIAVPRMPSRLPVWWDHTVCTVATLAMLLCVVGPWEGKG